MITLFPFTNNTSQSLRSLRTPPTTHISPQYSVIIISQGALNAEKTPIKFHISPAAPGEKCP